MKNLLTITAAAILALSTQSNVMASETLGQKIDDAKIVTIINADLVKDKELKARKINVDSTQGIVVLRGTAPSMEAKNRATTIAQNVKDVATVDNELVVGDDTASSNAMSNNAMSSNSMNRDYNNAKNTVSNDAHTAKDTVVTDTHKVGDKIDDAAINVAVHSGLAGDNDLSTFKINVDVKNGSVWLHGTAPSLTAKHRATTIAKNVNGVRYVHNDLTVTTVSSTN